ncbi:hypothetical protein TKK_0000079 [Trichogramma kaykai]
MSFYFREKPQFGERFREKFGDDIFKELKQEFGDDADFFADRPQTQSTTPEQQQQQQHRQRKSSQPSSAAHNPMRSAFDRSFPRYRVDFPWARRDKTQEERLGGQKRTLSHITHGELSSRIRIRDRYVGIMEKE